jgi:anti-anti-sigma factor
MAMQTTVERVEARVPVTVMALSGELDASNYLRLVDDVRPLYAAGARNLLLDLTDLTFISSSGLVSLYSILKVMQGQEPPDPEYGWSALHAMERDAEDGATQDVVRLCGMQLPVAEVLQRTGLDAMFPSYPDRETALAAF